MSLSDFLAWVRVHNCELIPMPEWRDLGTIEILNRRNGKNHFLNTIHQELFPATIERACVRLGIPLPPNYAE